MTSTSDRRRDVLCYISWRDSGCGAPCIVSDFGFARLDPRGINVDLCDLYEGQLVRCCIVESSGGLEATSVVLQDSDTSSCDETDSEDSPAASVEGNTCEDPSVFVHRNIQGIVETLDSDRTSGRLMTDHGDFPFKVNDSRTRMIVFQVGDLVICDVGEMEEGPEAVNVVLHVSEPSQTVSLLVRSQEQADLQSEFALWFWTVFSIVFGRIRQTSHRLFELCRTKASRFFRHTANISRRLSGLYVRMFQAVRVAVNIMSRRRQVQNDYSGDEDFQARLSIARQLSLSCQDEDGFDTDRFVSEVSEELVCPICRGVLNDPVTTPCDHLFCRTCLARCLSLKPECPMDKGLVRIDEDVKDAPHYVKNMMASLRLRCDFAARGCKKIVTLKDLQGHEKECRYRQLRE